MKTAELAEQPGTTSTDDDERVRHAAADNAARCAALLAAGDTQEACLAVRRPPDPR